MSHPAASRRARNHQHCISISTVSIGPFAEVSTLCPSDELSSYLANRVLEMKQLIDATDYDEDFY